jgi:peroxiredoxin
MIRVGSVAPEVHLRLDSGERFRLQNIRTKQPLVLMFLPNAHSIDVQRDGYEFIAHLQSATSLGAYLLAVSPSDLSVLRDFLRLYTVPLSIARDESLEVCRNYRVVWLRGSAIRRATFVIDDNGIVRASVHHDLVMEKHWSSVIRSLQEMKTPPSSSSMNSEAT